MKRAGFLAVALLFGIGSAEPALADVTGKVTFAGEAPARVVLKGPATDPQVGRLPIGPMLSEDVIVGKDGELANAVVYLEGDLPAGAPDAVVHMEELNGRHVPHVVSATVGQHAVISNADPFLHNANIKAVNNKPKNAVHPIKGSSDALPTEKAEFYEVRCNVHSWMKAWVAVLPHRYHAVSSEAGTFAIDTTNLKDGEYDVSVWHEKYGNHCARGTVMVKDGKGEVKLVAKHPGAAPKPAANPPAAAPATAGVVGKVTFDGVPPARVPLKAAAADPNTRGLHKEPPLSEVVIVGPAGELANAVVYLKGDLPTAAPETTVTIEQAKGLYVPHVASATVGQRVDVANRDPFLHNVNVKTTENKPKGMAQPARGQADIVPTEVPEFYQIACNVHPWMSAWVAVLPHRYHAVTTADGTFAIDTTGLKDGTYDVAVWHEKYKDACATGRVVVKDGKGEVNLVVKPKEPAAKPAAGPPATAPARAGVTGKVTFDGVPPPRVPLKALAGDPAFAKLYGDDPPRSEQVIVGPAGELANAVVYLSGDLTSAAPEATVHIGQIGGMYFPHVVSATVGQKLVATNHDDVRHHNNVKSAVAGCVAQPSSGKADVLPTKAAEFYQVACNVHPWMSAWVAVLPHRYHAVTDDAGEFDIDVTGLKDGAYDVAVWHEKYKDACATGTVTVKDGKGAVNLVVKPKTPAARPAADSPTTGPATQQP